jgi:uncharacterized protein
VTEQPDSPAVGVRPSREPLGRIERRVLGVLIEKAKTTPDSYPMTLAALVTGCNQKSNRAPQMQLDEDDVLLALDRLRAVGAVREVQGTGRVAKYRHAAYEWLEVSSAEAAVMTELLLRGAQTAGELRARAARLEPFADLAAILPVIESLEHKGWVVPVTPAGRGQVFAHTLYSPEEMAKVRAEAAGAEAAEAGSSTPPTIAVSAAAGSGDEEVQRLVAELRELRGRIERIEARLDA